MFQRHSSFLLFAGVIAFALASSPVHSRPIGIWSYADLLKAADVAIIAQAEVSTDTQDMLGDQPGKENFVGVNTKFKIQVVLKSEWQPGQTIQVLHFRMKNKDLALPNGPRFVTFRTGPATLEMAKGKFNLDTPSYLLFLKGRADGRYEMVTGQYDPVDAVRALLPAGVLPEKQD
jgi:hypothetical protein